jgi:hypothetical protein
VAQPPLPLQEFFPLQPLSLDLQPPLPWQEFLPLQECLSVLSSAIWRLFTEEKDLVECEFCANAVFPATKPARAALTISDFMDFDIVIRLLEIVWVVPSPRLNLRVDLPQCRCDKLSHRQDRSIYLGFEDAGLWDTEERLSEKGLLWSGGGTGGQIGPFIP